MAVYRPKYRDKETGELMESKIYWYNFTFAGRRIQESSKSRRKTVAQNAEKKRRRNSRRPSTTSPTGARSAFGRSRTSRPSSWTTTSYGTEVHHLRGVRVGHLKRLLGSMMVADVGDTAVKDYQTARLKEKSAPKSINEEVGFLLRMLEDQGDAIRVRLKRQKRLKLTVARSIAQAFPPEEKAALLAAAATRRSPSIHPALMLALHAEMRDAELRNLQWMQINLHKAIVTVGESKTEAGDGRTIPLTADVLAALVAHSKWYLKKFGETRPEWYVFPFGKPQPTDPTRPATSFKTVWAAIKKKAGVTGRWHDNRHTFITDLAESNEASDETIRDMAGHVSKQMLKHYSHIRMEAKRRAVGALVKKPAAEAQNAAFPNENEPAKEVAKVGVLN